MEEVKVFIGGKEDDKFTKAVVRFYELIQGEVGTLKVDLESLSPEEKESYHRSALIHSLFHEIDELKKSLDNIKANTEEYGMNLMRIDECKIEKVIMIGYIQGFGDEKNPYQYVNEYRTLEGKLIAKVIF